MPTSIVPVAHKRWETGGMMFLLPANTRRCYHFRQMTTEDILALLIAERDKLNLAIDALGDPVKSRGRPPKNPFATAVTVPAKAVLKRKSLSPAKRKAQSKR